MKIIDSIFDQQKKPFTSFLNEFAGQLLQNNASKTQRINALITELKSAQGQLIKNAKIFLRVQ